MAIIDVVKYNGSPNVFAWKFPNEELSTWTQLIVNESQEAILFKGGQALDVFPSGRYVLETGNIPILNNIVNIPFGGKSPFTAEVWYVNKVFSLDIKWGTTSPVQLQDPLYKIFVPLRAFGQFGIQIADSKKFLVKLVGTLPVFDKVNLVNYFRGLFLTKVKDSISSYLIHKEISVMQINAYIDELSDYIKEKIVPELAKYGISLVNFYVNDINVPEGDASVIKLKEALAKRAEMDIVGFDYTQQRSFDTLEGAAKNPGAGNSVMGAGIGLGMGVGIGGALGSQSGGISEVLNTSGSKKCPNCDAKVGADKRFCGICGADMLSGNDDVKKIKCGKCGTSISDEKTKFCPDCGTSLIKKCGKCGKDVKDHDSKFCTECGEKL